MIEQDLLCHAQGLFRYAMVLSRNPTDAEDLLQETYARALKSIGTFQPGSEAKRWLFTILRNIWVNELRRRRALPKFAEFDPGQIHTTSVQGVSENPLEIHLASLERDMVRRAIQTLPLMFSEVVILREYEDLTCQEIAELLGCPIGTVMSRLTRARTRLRSLLTAGLEHKPPSQNNTWSQLPGDPLCPEVP